MITTYDCTDEYVDGTKATWILRADLSQASDTASYCADEYSLWEQSVAQVADAGHDVQVLAEMVSSERNDGFAAPVSVRVTERAERRTVLQYVPHQAADEYESIEGWD